MKKESVFNPDEMTLKKVNSQWTTEDLLNQEGIFHLTNVAKKLRISSAELIRRAIALANNGGNTWEEMGVNQVWSHWVVRMKVFAPYIRGQIPPVHDVDPSWNGKELLSQAGIFRLIDVCSTIPFNANQIRYHAHRNPNSKKEYGVWKDETLNAFLVDMDTFSQWIKKLWLGSDPWVPGGRK